VRRNRWSVALALPLTVALAATACGGSSSGGKQANGTPKASGLPAIDIAATSPDNVKDGGSMVMAIEQFGKREANAKTRVPRALCPRDPE
jgi:hypothetical protein